VFRKNHAMIKAIFETPASCGCLVVKNLVRIRFPDNFNLGS